MKEWDPIIISFALVAAISTVSAVTIIVVFYVAGKSLGIAFFPWMEADTEPKRP